MALLATSVVPSLSVSWLIERVMSKTYQKPARLQTCLSIVDSGDSGGREAFPRG